MDLKLRSVLLSLSAQGTSDCATLDLDAPPSPEHLSPAFCLLLPEVCRPLQSSCRRKGTLEAQLGGDGWNEINRAKDLYFPILNPKGLSAIPMPPLYASHL